MKVEYLNIGVRGDLGFTASIERQEGARVGDQQNPSRRALRATQIFRKENGAWKLLHRHADPLIEKQSTIDSPTEVKIYRSKVLASYGQHKKALQLTAR